MPRRSRIRELEQEIEALTADYEKKIFDLEQLIGLSKSLNSSIEFGSLIQSVLYICMGQLRVLKAGIFVRKDASRQNLVFHRNQVGFEIDHHVSYTIPEDHPILPFLNDHLACFTMSELAAQLPEAQSLKALASLEPALIIPLRAKNTINGIIVLADPILDEDFTPEERRYAETIATLSGVAVHNAWLYEITTTDMMTRLRLRHYFLDNLSTIFTDTQKNKRRLFLIMIDIDSFKMLNDTYGHVAGDLVIKQVAEVLLSSIRQNDLAARYGGEEFVVLVNDAVLETATAIAERIRLSIQDTCIDYLEHSLHVTVSVGIASYDPKLDKTMSMFIERADKALYQSKAAGKNVVTLA